VFNLKKLLFATIVLALLFRDFLLYQAATLKGSILWFGLDQENAVVISQVLFYVVLFSLVGYLISKDKS
jgi:type III secretory pathway component EscU